MISRELDCHGNDRQHCKILACCDSKFPTLLLPSHHCSSLLLPSAPSPETTKHIVKKQPEPIISSLLLPSPHFSSLLLSSPPFTLNHQIHFVRDEILSETYHDVRHRDALSTGLKDSNHEEHCDRRNANAQVWQVRLPCIHSQTRRLDKLRAAIGDVRVYQEKNDPPKATSIQHDITSE